MGCVLPIDVKLRLACRPCSRLSVEWPRVRPQAQTRFASILRSTMLHRSKSVGSHARVARAIPVGCSSVVADRLAPQVHVVCFRHPCMYVVSRHSCAGALLENARRRDVQPRGVTLQRASLRLRSVLLVVVHVFSVRVTLEPLLHVHRWARL